MNSILFSVIQMGLESTLIQIKKKHGHKTTANTSPLEEN